MTSVPIDDIDRHVIALLQENARRSLSDIAQRVNLSVAPVKRRIDRLEAAGVIAGYTAIVPDVASASGIEAFMQLRITPGADVAATLDPLRQMPEVREVLITAGEQDALVRLRVDGMNHLRAVVMQIRRTSTVVETRTHIILDRWDRTTDPPRALSYRASPT
jgi:DNA-binding Lrp family transcriptional regulator